MTNSTNNPASAAGVLSDERIDLIANDGMRNAAGGIYSTRVYEFARAIQSEVLAAARAQATGQAVGFDGDSEATRKAFRHYDAEYPVSHRSHWQIWRDAIAYAVKSGVAAPSPAAREAGDGVTPPALSEDVLMQAIADTAARGHVWASRALSNFRAAVREAATSSNDA
jgi:hypothetical protein